MNREELIKKIKKELFKKDRKTINAAVTRRIKFKESELYNNITNTTSFLNIRNPQIGERIHCIFNNITELPKCIHCGTPIKKYRSFVQGYAGCVNMQCMRKTTKWNSSSHTKKETYSKNIRNFLHIYHKKEYKLLDVETLKKYIEEKKKRYFLNVQYVNSSNIKTEINELASALYYTEEKIPISEKLRMSERFYIILENITNIPKCVCGKNSKYLNIFKGYQKNCSKKCSICENLNNIRKNVLVDQNIKILSFDNNQLQNKKFEVLCKNCDTKHSRELFNARWKDIYCPTCYGYSAISKEEKDVLNYIKKIITDCQILENDKTLIRTELDIYIPNKKVAFEYNGLLWHSFGKNFPKNIDQEKNKKLYMRKKSFECFSKDVTLFHINSDEWCDDTRKDIWKSIINNSLKNSKKIYARKCKIVNVSTNDALKFLNENHLKGSDNSKIKIGLMYDNELVSLMTLSKPRFNKQFEYELIRYCNKKYHTVIGGASKIFKHFKKTYNPISVISYADCRYSNGSLYKKLGFSFKRYSNIGYFYFKNVGTKNYKKISRYSAQKHKLPKLLDSYSENLTESENMFNNGYRRFWDCGNMVFFYKKDVN